jgi:hypothetical protein
MPSISKPRRSSAPFLYKYSSAEHLDWLQSILLKHELYFPNPRELNDPTEARPKLFTSSQSALIQFFVNDFMTRNAGASPTFLATGIKQIHIFVPHYWPDRIIELLEEALHSELASHRIYSLTIRANNHTLWEHYALNHTGYCLEFENRGMPFALAQEVTYGDTVTLDLTDRDQINAFFIFSKTMDWKDEQEARIVLFPRGRPALVPFEPTLLRRVILGKNMTAANRKTIREWADMRVPPLIVEDE